MQPIKPNYYLFHFAGLFLRS